MHAFFVLHAIALLMALLAVSGTHGAILPTTGAIDPASSSSIIGSSSSSTHESSRRAVSSRADLPLRKRSIRDAIDTTGSSALSTVDTLSNLPTAVQSGSANMIDAAASSQDDGGADGTGGAPAPGAAASTAQDQGPHLSYAGPKSSVSISTGSRPPPSPPAGCSEEAGSQPQ
ncbi:hypothetical protein K437DRAFT_148618 [Tilletiaria anomala UBC 951]|uniref:Uncharacterized protein n=1 Tax=Tilletiaria anomala (strain ATCC 24038 / CBS 436.72 / UBC 951) TaxID=1037660 RepID=A0A066WFP8_TILAU|nr:uncharacterized protein K437DRAFT_148618 [Tilletiaria anomala UBC 951]KDN52797.1 hypothetical protein K437DRAFT_148618 [Tilletiaria anomala UBC 951]